MIRDVYLRELNYLDDTEIRYHIKKRFVEHLIAFYLAGKIERLSDLDILWDSDKFKLIGDAFDSICLFFERNINAEDLEIKKINEIKQLCEKVLNRYKPSGDYDEFYTALSGFIVSLPIEDPKWQLAQTKKLFAHNFREFYIKDIFEQMKNWVNNFPDEVLDTLEERVSNTDSWQFQHKREVIYQIFENLIKIEDERVNIRTVVLINLIGAKGFYEFKNLL